MICSVDSQEKREKRAEIGPLHDPVTWYKIIYTGEQVGQWDFQNNAPGFVLKSHSATCSPVYLILYHVTESCKGPIVGLVDLKRLWLVAIATLWSKTF